MKKLLTLGAALLSLTFSASAQQMASCCAKPAANLSASATEAFAMLAADVLGWVGQRRPQWLVPHLPGLLVAAQPGPGQHPAVRRSVARVLQFVPVPEALQALAFDTCLGMLQSPAEPVAIRAYALSAAVRLAMPYPELTSELLAAAEVVLAITRSAALHSRAERELPKLRSVLREDLPG